MFKKEKPPLQRVNADLSKMETAIIHHNTEEIKRLIKKYEKLIENDPTRIEYTNFLSISMNLCAAQGNAKSLALFLTSKKISPDDGTYPGQEPGDFPEFVNFLQKTATPLERAISSANIETTTLLLVNPAVTISDQCIDSARQLTGIYQKLSAVVDADILNAKKIPHLIAILLISNKVSDEQKTQLVAPPKLNESVYPELIDVAKKIAKGLTVDLFSRTKALDELIEQRKENSPDEPVKGPGKF